MRNSWLTFIPDGVRLQDTRVDNERSEKITPAPLFTGAYVGTLLHNMPTKSLLECIAKGEVVSIYVQEALHRLEQSCTI